MANTEERAVGGAVAFDDDRMLFIASAVSGKEKSLTSTAQTIKSSPRNRWAYLGVGYKECEKLRKNNPDSEALLQAIQKKYQDILIDTVESYDGITLNEIRDMKVLREGKEVYLQRAKMTQCNCIKHLLLANRMYEQVKHLKEYHKKPSAKTTRMTLEINRHKAQELLKDDHCYAIVALAYAYKDVDEHLELVPYPEVQVAFVPRMRLECGVFFDGTLNNMLNTQMRKAYEDYFELKSKMISGQMQTTPNGWESKILNPSIPKSDIMPLIFKDLQSAMKDIYGKERASVQEYNDGWAFGWFEDDVSKDCDAIYSYFRDSGIQRLLNDIQKVVKTPDRIMSATKKKEKIKNIKQEAFKGNKAFLSKEQHSDNYIENKILISGEESSYTGALSNVAKLYKLYDTDNVAGENKQAHRYECFKEKIYVTGAGTHFDKQTSNHEEDDLFLGQALAIGDAGIKAKVNNACKQLHKIVGGIEEAYIDTLVLDVFGFSRGAAEARHFVGLLSKDLNCTFKRTMDKGYTEYELTKQGENLYPHILREEENEKGKIIIDKIIFRFIGVFDTVPHYGLFQSNEEGDLELKLESTKMSKVVHLIANDEFRHNFALVSLKTSENEELSNHFEEKVFFGAHSDIGGGYRDDKEETIELPTQYKRNVSKFYDKEIITKIKVWNKKHSWVKQEAYIDFISKIDEIGMHGDGFYIKKYISRKREGKVQRDVSRYHIYMYRKHLDTEYSQIPLEYMHQKAKEVAPFREMPYLSYKEIDILYNNKDEIISLNPEVYKEIKPQFFHHSITVSVANEANSTDDVKEFYGKRKIYYM